MITGQGEPTSPVNRQLDGLAEDEFRMRRLVPEDAIGVREDRGRFRLAVLACLGHRVGRPRPSKTGLDQSDGVRTDGKDSRRGHQAVIVQPVKTAGGRNHITRHDILSTIVRLSSLDALRGFIMIIMALGHTREFFHWGAMSFSPEYLSRATPLLFFTRWITHLCAPVVMFTAGAAAFLWLERGHTKAQLSSFLWKRGLWLALLELTAFRFAISFSLTSGPFLRSVLWALGLSMIVLAALIHLPHHLPLRVLTVVSIATIARHHFADAWRPESVLWSGLHRLAVIPLGGVTVITAHPLIPWFAVMALGFCFCFGSILKNEPAARQQITLRLGLATTAAFIGLRWLNIYGDPSPWTSGVLSFLRTNKYPPSLQYLLMTLGPALILFSWLDRRERALPNPLIVFGRVPLFFFYCIFYVLHLLTYPFALFKYGEASFALLASPAMGGNAAAYPPPYGYDLLATYGIWIGLVIGSYPICLWFARWKARDRAWWLIYL